MKYYCQVDEEVDLPDEELPAEDELEEDDEDEDEDSDEDEEEDLM